MGPLSTQKATPLSFLFNFFVLCLCAQKVLSFNDCQPCDKYHCICLSQIHNITVETNMLVQHCDNPVGVTFTVEVNKLDVVFEHTFSNSDETVEVAGWKGFQLHVQMTNTDPANVKLMAAYKIYNKEQGLLIDRIFVINRHDCTVSYERTGGLGDSGKIAIAVVALVLVIIVCVILIVLYRRNHICTQKLPLVEEMETPATSDPYQEGPTEDSLRVEYRANKNSLRSEGRDEIISNPNAQSTDRLATEEQGNAEVSISRPRPKGLQTGNPSVAQPVTMATGAHASPTKATGAIPKVRLNQNDV